MLVSVIIPCYNSANSLETVVLNIISNFKKQQKYTYEIILINDASTDNTLQVMKLLHIKYADINCIDFAKNFGQHAALMAGFRVSNGDYIICMDDDGQTDPCEMFKLIAAFDDNTDVVYAKYIEKKHNFIRNFCSYLNDKMVCVLLHKKKDLFVSSYFVVKRYVANEIIKYTNPYPYVLGLILRTTDKIKNVEVIHKERQTGGSGYTFKKLMALWINGFTSFSIIPLRVATLFGFIFAIFGFIFSIYIVVNKLMNPGVPTGWSSLISTVFFMSGVILMVLGLMGEYIGRSFISLNKAPQYVIRDFQNEDEYEKN